MADFKDEFSPELVAALAAELTRAWPAFPADRFTAEAGDGLASLGLMQRAHHIAAALARALPPAFGDAAVVLGRALDSPDLTGWMTQPVCFYVADHGLDAPELALALLARLTPRFSSEFAVRPFIEHRPEVAYRYLHQWVTDPDEHVRRLVPEGTRPRLPWASRLPDLIADPSPAIALLDLLADDPSAYVRRSVANHLNDIAKDHPELALECARRWTATGGDGSAWVARHGLRTLVKQGHPDALALLGFDHAADIRLEGLSVTPARLPIGEEVTIEFSLSSADGPVRAVVDYLVHHAGARGLRGPRVFKLSTTTLRPDRPHAITRRHRFQPMSVRRIYPGTHRIEIQVNGRVLGGADVELVAG